MKKIYAVVFAVLAIFCTSASAHHFENHLDGQKMVCKGSPKAVILDVSMKEGRWALDPDKPDDTISAWVFNDTLPGKVFEVCQGDTVTYRVKNDGDMTHGFDPHSLNTDASVFGNIKAGETREITGVVEVPGIFMHHCAAGANTDVHITMGMGSTTIVYPSPKIHVMKKAEVEIAVVVGATPDESLYFFNGTIKNKPIELPKGKLVRLYVQSVAHGFNTIHVIGANNTTFFTGWDEARKNFVSYGTSQGFPLTNGNGVIVEFTPKTAGKRMLVDHDHLDFLGKGFVLPFITK